MIQYKRKIVIAKFPYKLLQQILIQSNLKGLRFPFPSSIIRPADTNIFIFVCLLRLTQQQQKNPRKADSAQTIYKFAHQATGETCKETYNSCGFLFGCIHKLTSFGATLLKKMGGENRVAIKLRTSPHHSHCPGDTPYAHIPCEVRYKSWGAQYPDEKKKTSARETTQSTKVLLSFLSAGEFLLGEWENA